MERTALAYWTIGGGMGELRSETLPEPAPGQALVQAAWSGVSRGSELLVHRGGVPPSEHERMRAPHQVGDFPFPVKYGYSSVGRVLHGPPELLGREVFCLYPHQTAYVVDAAQLVPLPSDVPAPRAVLAANMETALNAVWDAELKAGDRVTVVGAGVVGLLVAYLAARHPGTEVELVDIDAAKVAIASTLGLRCVPPDAARGGADVVVHASGAPSGLRSALRLAASEAAVVELSWYGDEPVPLPLGAEFHALRLRLRSSQVSGLPPSQRARWTHRRRLELALRLLADARLDRLVDDCVPLAELPHAMQALSSGDLRALCLRVAYA